MCKLENIILLGDFNSEVSESAMEIFCETYNLKNLVAEPTCFKNPSNPSSIDVILTNRSKSFQNTCTLECGLSDHHKMIITVLKTSIPKQGPTLVKYRDYKKFNDAHFRQDLQNNISNISDETCHDTFQTAFIDTLNMHAPIKSKYVRANNPPFINRSLSKAIMTRSRLKNKYNKSPNKRNKIRYKKRRNYGVNLTRKVKREYYSKLDINSIKDNKKFWDLIKPCFSDKSIARKRITLLEENTTVTKDKALAETFNVFFSVGSNEDNRTKKNESKEILNESKEMLNRLSTSLKIILVLLKSRRISMSKINSLLPNVL